MTDDTNIDIDWTRHNFPAKGYGQVVLKEFQIPQPHNIIFYSGSPLAKNEVLRITKDGITANPAFPPDEAAAAVLRALDGQIKQLTHRTWVGLTKKDMDWLHENTPCIEGNYGYRFIKAIEAKLKEKNT